MGNDYCVSRRNSKSKISEHRMFQQDIQYQLERLKDIDKKYIVIQYENKSIEDLLRNIDINITNQVNREQENQNLNSQDSIVIDFAQFTQFGNEIIQQLQQKIKDLTLKKQDWSLLVDDNSSTHFLKLQMSQTQMEDGNKINTIISQFIVPCNPKRFIYYMGNFQEQKQLDLRIDQFRCISKNKEDQEQIIYLSYKSVSIISARDFIYFKKTKLIDETNDIWCDASRSIDNNNYCSVNNKIVRGTIYLSGYVIQPLKNVLNNDPYSQRFASISKKAENYSFVQMCSQCDFKLKVPFYIAKGQVKQEMINYINLLYRNLQ
ncbi:unnamed protein product (macronuclear) [Paramecium tetraurelia]|uniref:START domain-containing protein n=1 Tax=Paramecium tetraurelia TaxID=5888 RepID=A0BG37_PARTE|nr:uncharacterized protein GSPATT00028539001 [Paramecium tetraurelia]CAK57504.1 unnamed protein product [Paramecium tetraurelia]|eukprot:XP_001424902.1 hypothetical protein (macronuclear) [Paramecium tetraurelia strain d4-2]